MYISNEEWNLIRTRANTAFDTLFLADEEEYITPTVALWKEVFGTEFNIDEIKK